MNRERLFIDTGAWIALLNSRDSFHIDAVQYYKSLSPIVQRVSSNHVISETYTWLRYKAGYAQASQFISVIDKAKENESLVIIVEDEQLIEVAQQILSKYADQTLSFVDALSMAVMKREAISKVFGFDHHFSLAGFELLPGRNK